MRRQDLWWLMKIFGSKARVVDVFNTLSLVAEMGEKLRAPVGA